jgi:DNA repair protein RadC
MVNHPSGETTPSEADIKVTRDLIRAGQLLKIEVLDHVVIGNRGEQP